MNQVIAAVFERYPQVGFPIVKGAKNMEKFRRSVFAGEPVEDPVENFIGDSRDSFTTVTTPAGDVETLYLWHRADFETAVRCLSAYCEPIEIPASMGAQTIGGLINWKKINTHMKEYLAGGGDSWDDEFERFTSVRKNYRDYLILLSSGPYSAVGVNEAGQALGRAMTEEEWIDKSVTIRKYHELTHFICRNLYAENQEAIRDEVIADAIGLIAAFGRYEADLARLFLGLENEQYRPGGRLENYYGEEAPESAQIRARRIIDEVDKALSGISGISDPDAIFRLVIRLEEDKTGMLSSTPE